MGDSNQYTVLESGNELVGQLRERYPEELESVNPEEVVVLGIQGEPPKRKKWAARIHLVRGAVKAMLELYRSNLRYYIEVYQNEWDEWSEPLRQITIFHELLHIPNAETSGLVDHDIEDFACIIDLYGIDYRARNDLPDMLSGTLVQFRKDLVERLRLTIKGDDDDDGGFGRPGRRDPPPNINLE